MKLFGQLLRTAVNVATLPLAVAADVCTLGGVTTDREQSYTGAHLDRLRDEASEDPNVATIARILRDSEGL